MITYSRSWDYRAMAVGRLVKLAEFDPTSASLTPDRLLIFEEPTDAVSVQLR